MWPKVEFDRELSDELTELDLAVANDLRLELIDLNVMGIPCVSRESAEAFLASGQLLNYAE